MGVRCCPMLGSELASGQGGRSRERDTLPPLPAQPPAERQTDVNPRLRPFLAWRGAPLPPWPKGLPLRGFGEGWWQIVGSPPFIQHARWVGSGHRRSPSKWQDPEKLPGFAGLVPDAHPFPGTVPLGLGCLLPPGGTAQGQKPQLPGRGSAGAGAGFGSPILRPLTFLSYLAPAG